MISPTLTSVQREQPFCLGNSPNGPFPQVINLKKVESFLVLEDEPPEAPAHPDRRIQDAVQPARLLMDSNGVQTLVFERTDENIKWTSLP